MKNHVLALATVGAMLYASSTLAQRDESPASKYKNDALVYAELSKAPQKARARRNPLANDADAVAAGRNLFEQHCSECHGDFAEGGKKGPSLRVEQVQTAEPGAIFWLLTNGVVWRGMPVWSKLPEPQRWQLVTFIKSLGVAGDNPTGVPASKSPSTHSTEPPSPRR